MSLRIEDSEVPSFASMGFHRQCAYSWPYHPFIKFLERHLEMDFLDYKQSVLDIRLPTGEAVRKRWWKSKFRSFIIKELRGLKLSHYNYVPTEENFFQEFPHLRNKWELQRAATVLRESANDRFGRKRSDFEHYLRLQWMVDRKYEFMMRWLGLRTEPNDRQRLRRKYFAYYSDCLLFCHHYECWKVRLFWLPIIFFVWITLQIYYTFNTKAFDIRLNSRKSDIQPNPPQIENQNPNPLERDLM